MTQTTTGLLTINEVAQQLRCDATTIRRWVKNGAMEAVSLPHVGKRQSYRVRLDTLNNILQTTTVATV
jgi:excisionase family DNA binding protein